MAAIDDNKFEEGDDDWNWGAEEDDEFSDQIGDDFKAEDESCKCLFLPNVYPTAQDALAADNNQLSFDFYALRKKLSMFISLQ